MSCARFEEEGLPRLEAGLPLAEHFSTCPDCRRAHLAFERLREAVARVGEGDEPAEGWQHLVWARIREEEPGRRRWPGFRLPTWVGGVVFPRLRLAAAGVLTAIFVGALVWAVLEPPWASAPPVLLTSVERVGDELRRGPEAQPGDELILEGGRGRYSHVELRVYFNDREMVARCGERSPCEGDGRRLRLRLSMSRRGIYQGLLIVSGEEIPIPRDDLDADAGAALSSGARVEVGDRVTVR